MLKNLIAYLQTMGIDSSNILVSHVDNGILISTNEETSPKIIEQLDRDELHPVIMNQVKVLSKVVEQTETSVAVSLTPVLAPKIILA